MSRRTPDEVRLHWHYKTQRAPYARAAADSLARLQADEDGLVHLQSGEEVLALPFEIVPSLEAALRGLAKRREVRIAVVSDADCISTTEAGALLGYTDSQVVNLYEEGVLIGKRAFHARAKRRISLKGLEAIFQICLFPWDKDDRRLSIEEAVRDLEFKAQWFTHRVWVRKRNKGYREAVPDAAGVAAKHPLEV